MKILLTIALSSMLPVLTVQSMDPENSTNQTSLQEYQRTLCKEDYPKCGKGFIFTVGCMAIMFWLKPCQPPTPLVPTQQLFSNGWEKLDCDLQYLGLDDWAEDKLDPAIKLDMCRTPSQRKITIAAINQYLDSRNTSWPMCFPNANYLK